MAPVTGQKGEVKPWPVAMLRATQPISAPKSPKLGDEVGISRKQSAAKNARSAKAVQTRLARRVLVERMVRRSINLGVDRGASCLGSRGDIYFQFSHRLPLNLLALLLRFL